MDIIDFLTIKDNEFETGTYYEEKPETPEDVGIKFNYKTIRAKESRYSSVLSNINTERQSTDIRTNDLKTIKPKSYAVLQDGGLWQVNAYTKFNSTEDDEEVLRLFKQSSSAEYIVRLIKIYDKWGIS